MRKQYYILPFLCACFMLNSTLFKTSFLTCYCQNKQFENQSL